MHTASNTNNIDAEPYDGRKQYTIELCGYRPKSRALVGRMTAHLTSLGATDPHGLSKKLFSVRLDHKSLGKVLEYQKGNGFNFKIHEHGKKEICSDKTSQPFIVRSNGGSAKKATMGLGGMHFMPRENSKSCAITTFETHRLDDLIDTLHELGAKNLMIIAGGNREPGKETFISCDVGREAMEKIAAYIEKSEYQFRLEEKPMHQPMGLRLSSLAL